MVSNDFLTYALVGVYCAIFALIVLFRLNSSIGSEHEVRQLRNMVYAYLVLLFSDIVYALVESGFLTLGRIIFAVDNAASIFAISSGCYFWYRFVDDRLHSTYTFSRAYRYLVNTPILIILALDVISIFTGWMFYIDGANRYQATGLFTVQSLINFAYALIPTLSLLYRAIRTHSKLRRFEYATYAVYILAPVTAAIFEDLIPSVPVLELNIFVVILLLFLTLQNLQIYNDALTDLNNRRRLDQYLERRLEDAGPDNQVLLFMLDINRFKSINDRFGHIEGDNALRMFSQALKTVASRYGAFIARYGGDEFCLVTDALAHTPAEVEADITEALRITQASAGKPTPYEISTSLGYAIRDTPGFDVSSFIAEADAMLYRNKKGWHRENSR